MRCSKVAAAAIGAAALAVSTVPAAAAAPAQPWPERRPVGDVRIVDRAFVDRSGTATVWVQYRLPYRRSDRGPTRATIEFDLRQGRVTGRETVRHLRADGRMHFIRVMVDPNGRSRFRPGRAYATADLNTRRRTLDTDRRWVYLRGVGWRPVPASQH